MSVLIQGTRKGGWQQTFSGVAFWPLDPRPEDIRIEDIAHALSLICRYGGQCREHYSVGQHSILVGEVMEVTHGKEGGLAGLLHDASEAYLGDVISPLKKLPEYAFYRIAELNLQTMIEEKFGVTKDATIHEAVKVADMRTLATEKRDMHRPEPQSWELNVEPYEWTIIRFSPAEIERAFMQDFVRFSR